MNEQQRERTNTVYYDAHTNFGTPPIESGGDYKMAHRRASGAERERPEDVLYERVHTERRQHHSSSSSSAPQQPRPPSRDPLDRPVIHSIRSPTGPVLMAPMSTSYGSPSAFRAQSGADRLRWTSGQHEDFQPGPRASSAANIDALFAPKKGRSQSSTSGVVPPPSSRIGAYPEGPTNVVFTRKSMEPKDFGVVGAYSNERTDPILYGGRHGSVRQHSNDYELDPRLNVTYPQFYVDDWKERHHSNTRDNSPGYQPRATRQSPSFSSAPPSYPQMGTRPRYGSDATHSSTRHVYEEVPMNGYRSPAPGYGRSTVAAKETAILDDYDNVPNEFLVDLPKKSKDETSNLDGESAIYQPGRYQPC
ncbi:unnamed protein product [Caenorhabditis sp. 36 PRJEB53466]|nr:unnamed protein product [Caenorhabditis sp. 36 PRJEB53466]